jgi:hypothetical protein
MFEGFCGIEKKLRLQGKLYYPIKQGSACLYLLNAQATLFAYPGTLRFLNQICIQN